MKKIKNSISITFFIIILLVIISLGFYYYIENKKTKNTDNQITKDIEQEVKTTLTDTGLISKSITKTTTECIKNVVPCSQQKTLLEVDELVRVGSSENLKTLALFIETLPPGDYLQEVIRRTATITNTDSLPEVISLIQTSKNPDVIRVAQEIFARKADEESIKKVLDIYNSKKTSSELRDLIERTLTYVYQTEMVNQVYINLLNDDSISDGIFTSITSALAMDGRPPSVDALTRKLNTLAIAKNCLYFITEECATEKILILSAAIMDKIDNPLAEQSLQTAASGENKFSTNPLTRTTAITALRKFPSQETKDLLKVLEEDPSVSFIATEILESLKYFFDTPH